MLFQRTVKQVAQQDQDVLHDVCPLPRQLQHARLALLADKEYPVSIEITLDSLCAFLLLCPLDGLDLGQLVLRQVAGPHCALPGDRPLADIVLQRGEVRWRVQRHVISGLMVNVVGWMWTAKREGWSEARRMSWEALAGGCEDRVVVTARVVPLPLPLPWSWSRSGAGAGEHDYEMTWVISCCTVPAWRALPGRLPGYLGRAGCSSLWLLCRRVLTISGWHWALTAAAV